MPPARSCEKVGMMETQSPAAGPARSHLLWPLGAMLLAFLFIEFFGLDRPLAHALYYDDVTRQWLGSGAGDWWAHRLVHDAGRWCVRGVAAGALAGWILSYLWPRARAWRETSRFVFL